MSFWGLRRLCLVAARSVSFGQLVRAFSEAGRHAFEESCRAGCHFFLTLCLVRRACAIDVHNPASAVTGVSSSLRACSETADAMAHLHDDGQYVGDEYMVVDFEDDAEDQLQAARDRNSLDSDSDDEIDVVSRLGLRLGLWRIPGSLCCYVLLYVLPLLAPRRMQCLFGMRWASLGRRMGREQLQWKEGSWARCCAEEGVRSAGCLYSVQ